MAPAERLVELSRRRAGISNPVTTQALLSSVIPIKHLSHTVLLVESSPWSKFRGKPVLRRCVRAFLI